MTSIRSPRLLASLLAATALMSAAAQAQTVPDTQGTIAAPERAGEQLRPSLEAPTQPVVKIPETRVQGAPAGAETIRFTLSALTLDGATVYKDAELRGLYADKIGKTVSLADVYAIANALTAKYRNDGYILTQVVVPPQTIDGGMVRLQVVEGRIDGITVEGTKGREGELIEALASRLKNRAPLNIRDLEHALLIVNDLPGVEARGVLSPSRTVPGAADLTIITTRDPMEFEVSLDDFGSRYLGPWQVGGVASLNSLLGMNEKISAQIAYAPGENIDGELAYGAVSWAQPVGTWGTVAEIFASHTNTNPGYDLAPFHVLGRSDYVSLALKHPFLRSRTLNLSGRALLDARNVESKNNLEAERNDYIRALRIGGRIEASDTLLGAGVSLLDIEAAKGLDLFGASDQGDDNMSRAEGDPQFFKVEGEAQRLQRITDDVNLLTALRGQWASDALLSAEEFGVGGATYGRGYDPSEIVGDRGFAGKVEVQWNIPNMDAQLIRSPQLYGFWDAGKVWNIDPTSSSQKIDSIASAGAGVRVKFATETEGGLAVAFPLTRDVQTQHDTDPRLLINLNHKF